jgi:hypothetical protein
MNTVWWLLQLLTPLFLVAFTFVILLRRERS